MKYAKILLAVMAAAALSTGSVQNARADGGLGGNIINYFVPGLGTAADAANRAIIDRSGENSEYTKFMHTRIPDAPFRSAPGAGAPPPPMNGGQDGGGYYPPPPPPLVYPAPVYYQAPPPPPPLMYPAPIYYQRPPMYAPPPVFYGPPMRPMYVRSRF